MARSILAFGLACMLGACSAKWDPYGTEQSTGEPKFIVWAGGYTYFNCHALIKHIVEDPEYGKRHYYGIGPLRAPYGCMYEGDEYGAFGQYLINLIAAGGDLGCIYRWTSTTTGDVHYAPMLRSSRANRDRYLKSEGDAFCVLGD
jgi:hypothetical protein